MPSLRVLTRAIAPALFGAALASCAPRPAAAPAPAPAIPRPTPPLLVTPDTALTPTFQSTPLVTWGPLPQGTQHADRVRTYDLQHQVVRVRFDWARHAVVGSTTITVAALDKPLSQAAFDAVGMNITSVRTTTGSVLRFTNDQKTVTVLFPIALPAHDKTSFTITYETVRPKKGAYFVDRRHVMWTQGETEDTRYWVPTYDEPNDKETWEFYITTSKGEKALSNGRLAGSSAVSGGTEWHWVQDQPMSTYLMTAATGPFVVLQDKWRTTPVDYWTYPDSVDATWRGMGKTPQMIDFFSRVTGVPYPYAKYDQLNAPDYIFGGMENVTATTQADDDILHPAWAEPQANAGDLVSHELAHQWYGDMLTTTTWKDIWLNEGFATFMEERWREEEFGVDGGAWHRRDTQQQTIDGDRAQRRPIVYDRWVTDPLELFYSNVYPKGAVILQSLRHELGDSLFWAAMHRYTMDHQYQNVVTSDLEHAFEQTAGRDFSTFFRQWVYGAGFPAFQVSQQYDAATHALTLTARQVQPRDSLTGTFDADVDVMVFTDSGVTSVKVPVHGETSTAQVALRAAPRAIAWNEGHWLLAITDFPRSTAMLAYQLDHDPDAMGRAETVDVLTARTNEPAAVAAIGHAARADAFYGVRAHAVAALGTIGGDIARPAVLAAAQDPDSRVRQAAASALAHFPGSESEARALALAQSDTSLFVRADATRSYAVLAPQQALPFLEQQLTQDSWTDVLRQSALDGLALIPSPHAFDLVQQNIALDKSRYVRLEAIQSLVTIAGASKRQAEAATALTPLLDAPDFFTRSAAADALGALGQAASVTALEARKQVEPESRVVNAIDAAIARLKGP